MFFSILKQAVSTQRDHNDDFWFSNYYGDSSLDRAATLSISMVYKCVRNIAEDVAKIPCMLYSSSDKGKERDKKNPLYVLMHKRPNEYQNAFEFIEMLTGHLSLRGNSYARMIFDKKGSVKELIPMHPDNVKLVSNGDDYGYIWTRNGIEHIPLLRSEVLHLRGLSSDGITGMSPIAIHAETLSMAATQRNYGRQFYKNNASPPGWIEYPARFKTEQDKLEFRNSWQRLQGGDNQGKAAVLENGMKYHQLSMSHVDIQHIETVKATQEDIAGIWRMPLHKVGLLDHATFSNIEEQNIEYVTDTLDPYFTRWEMALNNTLLDDDKHFYEFLREKLLRGNTIQRYTAYNFALSGGWMTRNEVREAENRNKLDGLDEPLQALNMSNPGGNPDKSKAIALNAAKNVLTKEFKFLERHLDSQDFELKVRDFFAKHSVIVMSSLAYDDALAHKYCSAVCAEVLQMDRKELKNKLFSWTDRAEQLLQLGNL